MVQKCPRKDKQMQMEAIYPLNLDIIHVKRIKNEQVDGFLNG